MERRGRERVEQGQINEGGGGKKRYRPGQIIIKVNVSKDEK